MDINELAAKIEAMEAANNDAAQQQQFNSFMGQYGGQFNNKPNIGMRILEVMDGMGVSAAAAGADRVVQEILDAMRMEVEELKTDLAASVAQVEQQVTQVQEAVAIATGGDPGMPPSDGIPSPMPEPMMEAPPEAMPPVDVGVPPSPEAPVEQAPPPEMPPPEEPPVAGEMPPPVPSDSRVKTFNIKPRVATPGPTIPAAKSWRPPASMLSAINRSV